MIPATDWRKACMKYPHVCINISVTRNVYLQIPILLLTTYISDVQWHPLHLYQNVYNLFKKEFLAEYKSLEEMKNATVGSRYC